MIPSIRHQLLRKRCSASWFGRCSCLTWLVLACSSCCRCFASIIASLLRHTTSSLPKLWSLLLNAVPLLFTISVLGATLSAEVLDSSLNESITTVPVSQGIALQVTLFAPPGDGPFPVVVINHGKDKGDAHRQARYRPVIAAKYFLARGYMVVVPMRQGFGASGGVYDNKGCDIWANGLGQAEDIRHTLDSILKDPRADKTRIIIVGQSFGGWAALAFGTFHYPGVKGLISFAGGLQQPGCPNWQEHMVAAVGNYAQKTAIPSLWFYGDNDAFFPRPVWSAMFDRYKQQGGKANLVAFGMFGDNSHLMFAYSQGLAIWQPPVDKFLQSLGLPAKTAFPAFMPPNAVTPTLTTQDSKVNDVSAVPYIQKTGRKGYQDFLKATSPRAFAIASDGAWGWAASGGDTLERALNTCQRYSRQSCKAYAVDQHVVWSAP